MKRKILALVCAMVLTAGMSMTVLAAPSAGASDIAGGSNIAGGSSSSTAADVLDQNPSTSAPASSSASSAQLTAAGDNVMGQVITESTLDYFAANTTVTSSVAGARVERISTASATAMIQHARNHLGANAFIATMFDLVVPEGTEAAAFTVECSDIAKGQDVSIFHIKSDGSLEIIKPDSVENRKVTFTMTSYSPVAIVVNAGTIKAPKTGDIILLIAVMTVISGIGTAVCAGKAKKN